jgi:hypothetical protein
MLSSISGQNDPWAQLAALRAAQSASQSSPSSGSAATTATPFSAGSSASSSANGTSGGAITGGAFPTLSSGLMSQLLSFGSVSGDGASGAWPSTGSVGVGFPSGPPAVPPTALPDGETGPGSLMSNLFTSLQSLISNLGSSLASSSSSSSTDAAGTTTTDSTTSATTTGSSAAAGSSGTVSTSGLGSALLQDLQSITSDFGGSGTTSAGSPTDTTAWNGPNGLPVGGPMFLPWNGGASGDGAAAGDTASSTSASSASTTGSNPTTASMQSANNALMQQINQAISAYMQSIAGDSSTIGASLTSVSA